MPMDFPDMKSLVSAAEVHKFRKPQPLESEAEYRKALADHVQPIDLVESMEIRNKVGWDKFNQDANADMIRRAGSEAAKRHLSENEPKSSGASGV